MAKGYKSIMENIPFGDTISNLIMFLRPAEWIDKVQFNAAAAFLLLMEGYYYEALNLEGIFKKFIIFLIYQIFLYCFGYSVNAYADRIFDHRAGKYRGVPYFSTMQIFLILIIISIGFLGIPFLFNDSRLVLLGIITYILAAGYSLKPLRFKERGLYGIVVANIPQRPLLILFFGLLVSANMGFMIIIIAWSLFLGNIMEIGHQMLDYQNDKTTGVDNWIVNTEVRDVKKVSAYFIFFFTLVTLAPLLFFSFRIALTFSFLMLIFSGHSIFYFLDGWKAYKKYAKPC